MMFKIFSRQKVFKMKKMNSMLLVTALSMVGITNSAFAEDGVITINGKVINGTCTLTGSAGATGTANNVAVQLDTVRNTAFTAANSTTGTKDFTLTVTGETGVGSCDALTIGAIKNITLSGTADTNYDSTNKSWLINTDTSAPMTKDVFVQILNVDGTPIDFSLTRQLSAPTAGAYALKAQYISNKASPASQTVKTSINYTLEYN